MRETHVGVSVHLSMPPFSVTKVTLEMQMSVCQPVTKTPQHYAYQPSFETIYVPSITLYLLKEYTLQYTF